MAHFSAPYKTLCHCEECTKYTTKQSLQSKTSQYPTYLSISCPKFLDEIQYGALKCALQNFMSLRGVHKVHDEATSPELNLT
jgi:hypothetical protein